MLFQFSAQLDTASALSDSDDEIVIQQWDEILRMIATIKLEEVSAIDGRD